jgi:cytochrome c biogenesis protein CcdA
MLIDALPLLFLGFGLGLMHALDADHIMAVSLLSQQKSGFSKTVSHSLYWGLGHGGILLCSGFLLFGFGTTIPAVWQHLAEISVGVLLIVMGLFCLRQFKRDNITLNIHQHGDVVHTHWHDNNAAHNKNAVHKPVLIGILHGLAGSAPALALIPAVTSGQVYSAMIYLLVFSIGVILSMLSFGFGFAKVQRMLNHRYEQVHRYTRYILGVSSIGLGSYWLFQAV